jgi:hypothetical protein
MGVSDSSRKLLVKREGRRDSGQTDSSFVFFPCLFFSFFLEKFCLMPWNGHCRAFQNDAVLVFPRWAIVIWNLNLLSETKSDIVQRPVHVHSIRIPFEDAIRAESCSSMLPLANSWFFRRHT